MLRSLSMIFILLLLPAQACADTLASPSVITLRILDHTLSAEIAHTPAAREKGLMHRPALEQNRGMLFIFPTVDIYGMWMLNTAIPLSVAFLDEQGIILNIANMVPFSTVPHYSAKPAKYALEMNLGWFAEKGITVGHQAHGLDQAPIAE
ncbi:MAG: DUF192 domain-containing protein [Nitrosomonas sp.]|nr:DUF192 domain-containing protein [Nitrosomonas sp.]